MRLILLGVIPLAGILVPACRPGPQDVQCELDNNCDRFVGGICHVAPSGNQWCAYPDPACPSGYRYSDLDVGDGVSDQCVIPTHLLTVQVGGNGSGDVVSDPAGLTCSADTCSGEFTDDTVVQLSANATMGSFLGWAEACRGPGTCTVTMDRDQTVGALFGTPGTALWVKQIGSEDIDSGVHVRIDGTGDLIAVGQFRRTIMVGPGLTSDGGHDIYVLKLSSSTGGVIWARRFGGTSDDYVSDVTVDGLNNIYICGAFQGTVDFGGGPLTATGSTATYALKFDADGNFGWVRKIDGSGLTGGAIAANGNTVIVAGDYTNSITVDTTTLMSAGSVDVFTLKMSASTGATTWFRSFGGLSLDDAGSVALDSGGNVVLTGTFRDTVNFGGGPLSTPGPASLNGFLLKLADASGAHLLSKQFSSRESHGAAIAIDPANDIYITGGFQESVDFGCASNPTASQANIADVFLVKYTQAGSCTWAKGFGGMATTSVSRVVSAIAVNNSGDVAVVGSFCGSISLGGGTLASASACPKTDAFAARFASDGMHLNSVRAGGISDDLGNGIAQSSDGRVFVTGRFSGFAEFGGEALNANGPSDAFIVGFAPM